MSKIEQLHIFLRNNANNLPLLVLTRVGVAAIGQRYHRWCTRILNRRADNKQADNRSDAWACACIGPTMRPVSNIKQLGDETKDTCYPPTLQSSWLWFDTFLNICWVFFRSGLIVFVWYPWLSRVSKPEFFCSAVPQHSVIHDSSCTHISAIGQDQPATTHSPYIEQLMQTSKACLKSYVVCEILASCAPAFDGGAYKQ